jgi:geranylgeranyl reductase family protein
MVERAALVVGCGPAGSAAASILAMDGHDVLAIDKAEFPREKPCGDGVLSDASLDLKRIGAWESVCAANFRRFAGLRLIPEGSRGVTVTFKEEQRELSFLAPRTLFDTLLREHAAGLGAELRTARALEPLWEDGRVVGVLAEEAGRRVELRARVVIVADGAASVLASRTRKNPPGSKAVALRGYVHAERAQDDYIQINLFKNLGLGYAWLFPLTPHVVNVGIATTVENSRTLDRSLRELLHDYASSEPVRALLGGGELHDVAAWTLNLMRDEMRDDLSRVLPGALLVGDAGGYVNPVTGAGISNALLTGRIAGEAASEALRAGAAFQTVLDSYDARSQAALEERMSLSRDLEQVLRVLVKAGAAGAHV